MNSEPPRNEHYNGESDGEDSRNRQQKAVIPGPVPDSLAYSPLQFGTYGLVADGQPLALANPEYGIFPCLPHSIRDVRSLTFYSRRYSSSFVLSAGALLHFRLTHLRMR